MLSRQILLEDIAAELKDAPPIIIPLQTHCEDEDESCKKGHLVGNDGVQDWHIWQIYRNPYSSTAVGKDMTLQEQEETTELRQNRELKVELCWSIFGQFLAVCCQGVPHSVSLQAGLL